jgi:protein SCO1/2
MKSPSFVPAGFLILLLVVALSATSSWAQLISAPNLTTQEEIQRSYLEQRLLAQVPREAEFVDDRGQPVRLGDYLNTKPILLVLGYFSCPNLCPVAFGHLTEELNGVASRAGRDFDVVIVSFDPHDTPAVAASHKIACLHAYKWPATAEGWHFLTGKEPAIDSLTTAVGFHYTFDRQQQRFIHPTGVMVLTPAGTISHYFFGIDAAPADMEAAIHDAAAGRSTRVDQAEQQYCVSYDPTLSVRGRHITHALDAMCVGWAAILFGYIGFKLSGDIRRRKSVADGRPHPAQNDAPEVEP